MDQTRGWFYSLLAISTLLFDKAPFKNVLVQGLVQDENGQKMSKSKGNAVDPMEALKKFGADPLRWYFYTNSAPWLPSRFHEKAVIEGQKKFFSTLWNTYAFYVLYANIDSFDPTQYRAGPVRPDGDGPVAAVPAEHRGAGGGREPLRLQGARGLPGPPGLCGRDEQLVRPPQPGALLGPGRHR